MDHALLESALLFIISQTDDNIAAMSRKLRKASSAVLLRRAAFRASLVCYNNPLLPLPKTSPSPFVQSTIMYIYMFLYSCYMHLLDHLLSVMYLVKTVIKIKKYYMCMNVICNC